MNPRRAIARCEHGYWFRVETLDSLEAIDVRGAKVQIFVCGGKHDLVLTSDEHKDVEENASEQ